MAIVAIAIRLHGRSPPLFKQKRPSRATCLPLADVYAMINPGPHGAETLVIACVSAANIKIALLRRLASHAISLRRALQGSRESAHDAAQCRPWLSRRPPSRP